MSESSEDEMLDVLKKLRRQLDAAISNFDSAPLKDMTPEELVAFQRPIGRHDFMVGDFGVIHFPVRKQ